MGDKALTQQRFLDALLDFQNEKGRPAVRATLNAQAYAELAASLQRLPEGELPEGTPEIAPLYSLKAVAVDGEQSEPVRFHTE